MIFSERLVEECKKVHLKFTLPTPLVDLHLMHQEWLKSIGPDKLGVYHLKLVGFENLFKNNLGPEIQVISSKQQK